MAFVINDRVKETTSTTGTGNITLAGAATGFQSFSSGIGSSNSTYYTIVGGNQWEVGVGSLTNATTFTRDSVISSSNTSSLVNFSSGVKDIFVTQPATKNVYLNSSNITINAASKPYSIAMSIVFS